MTRAIGVAALLGALAALAVCSSTQGPTAAGSAGAAGDDQGGGSDSGGAGTAGTVATGGSANSGGAGSGGSPPATEVFDPLTDASLMPGEADKQVVGGTFTADGWQATDGSSQIVIRLASPLRNPGKLEIDVTNFDPKSQSTGDKHEVVNLYSQASGSKAIFETQGAWWNLRTGANYLPDPMGIKFLSAVQGVATRLETRLQTPVAWDLAGTYTFGIRWNDSEITISLDDEPVQTHAWGSMTEPFEYVFIGTNNVYSAQVGPIYSNLRIGP